MDNIITHRRSYAQGCHSDLQRDKDGTGELGAGGLLTLHRGGEWHKEALSWVVKSPRIIGSRSEGLIPGCPGALGASLAFMPGLAQPCVDTAEGVRSLCNQPLECKVLMDIEERWSSSVRRGHGRRNWVWSLPPGKPEPSVQPVPLGRQPGDSHLKSPPENRPPGLGVSPTQSGHPSLSDQGETLAPWPRSQLLFTWKEQGHQE